MSCDYDQKSSLKSVVVVPPAVIAADNTPVALDLSDFKACTLQIYVGAGGITYSGSNRIDFVLTHSDDNVTFTPVTDNEVVLDYGVSVAALVAAGGAAGTVKSLVAAHASADTVLTEVGYIGKKLYLKVLADFSGTHGTGTLIGVNAILGHPLSFPINQSAYEH
jgi:hypothetical protein